MAVNATFIRRRGLKVCSVGHTRVHTDTHGTGRIGFVGLKIAHLVTFAVISIWPPENTRQWAGNFFRRCSLSSADSDWLSALGGPAVFFLFASQVSLRLVERGDSVCSYCVPLEQKSRYNVPCHAFEL